MIAIIAVIFAPLVAVIAIASPWHAAITGAGIVIAAACATAIQLWFRTTQPIPPPPGLLARRHFR